jgi:adenylate kinase family enzyme
MKRVLILGRGASGKSTLARSLGEITGLLVIELDKIFWRAGLLPTPRDQWVVLQEKLVTEEEWIMDGDLGPFDAIEVRLRAADAIIFLDFSSIPTISGACRLLALACGVPLSKPPDSHASNRYPRGICGSPSIA